MVGQRLSAFKASHAVLCAVLAPCTGLPWCMQGHELGCCTTFCAPAVSCGCRSLHAVVSCQAPLSTQCYLLPKAAAACLGPAWGRSGPGRGLPGPACGRNEHSYEPAHGLRLAPSGCSRCPSVCLSPTSCPRGERRGEGEWEWKEEGKGVGMLRHWCVHMPALRQHDTPKSRFSSIHLCRAVVAGREAAMLQCPRLWH